ncbi:hypothetical protein [Galbibacter orientalis]
MISNQREKAPKFYEILDGLMLSNFNDCKIVEGVYILENSEIEINVGLRS